MNFTFLFFVIVLFCGLSIQADTWKPLQGLSEIPIWPGVVPDSKQLEGPENEMKEVKDKLVAGKSWTMVKNVINPTITVYSPKENNTGVAVMVFPGGGYRVLAIDLEGTEVCDWLTSKGITCVLLKYRVPESGEYSDEKTHKHIIPKVFTALQDAQRAIGIVRHRAHEWKIDPHKVGVLGFSAGGHLAAAMSTNFKRIYSTIDDADKESCRPDFAVPIYPGHLWDKEKFQLKTDTHVNVTSETSPTFLLQAEDDAVDNINHSLVYYIALKNASVPVEMHLYAEGGHAFGLRHTRFPITDWPLLFEKWLGTIDMISN